MFACKWTWRWLGLNHQRSIVLGTRLHIDFLFVQSCRNLHRFRWVLLGSGTWTRSSRQFPILFSLFSLFPLHSRFRNLISLTVSFGGFYAFNFLYWNYYPIILVVSLNFIFFSTRRFPKRNRNFLFTDYRFRHQLFCWWRWLSLWIIWNILNILNIFIDVFSILNSNFICLNCL